MCTMDFVMKVTTHDMHTGGEPVRIIVSGVPKLQGSTILQKREYAKTHLDDYRKFLMNEPRGHRDMYGAILMQDKPFDVNFNVIFLHNEGYSTMCGHAVIALGRYVVDKGLVKPSSPKTEVIFHCPCGPVKASIQYNDGLSGLVSFQSVPAFIYALGAEINVGELGVVKIDIAFGGAFYAIIRDKNIGLNLKSEPVSKLVRYAALITDNVKKQVPIVHPTEKELSFLYGTIITDGNDKQEDGPSTNICVFANKQVDRSPTGSGVTARIALQFMKGLISLHETKEFKSIIGSSFSGKAVEKTTFNEYEAVIVEVSGRAYHTASQTFYLEKDDPLSFGFLINE